MLKILWAFLCILIGGFLIYIAWLGQTKTKHKVVWYFCGMIEILGAFIVLLAFTFFNAYRISC